MFHGETSSTSSSCTAVWNRFYSCSCMDPFRTEFDACILNKSFVARKMAMHMKGNCTTYNVQKKIPWSKFNFHSFKSWQSLNCSFAVFKTLRTNQSTPFKVRHEKSQVVLKLKDKCNSQNFKVLPFESHNIPIEERLQKKVFSCVTIINWNELCNILVNRYGITGKYKKQKKHN